MKATYRAPGFNGSFPLWEMGSFVADGEAGANSCAIGSGGLGRDHGRPLYEASLTGMYALAATYVDRILKGAKPADLPVEQPTKFELVINLKDGQGARLDDPGIAAAAGGRSDSVMDRREFVSGSVALALLAAPLAAEGQKSEKMARVGILGIGPAPSPQELAKSISTNRLWLSMRQLGWVEGQNMVVERRFGESPDQLRAGAADLVRLKVDVLFVGSAGLAKLLQLETKTIPIVVGRAEGDLVAAGLVDSLARPGGNITGAQVLNDDLVSKRLELLKTLVPNLSKVALLREDVTNSALPQLLARYDQQVATAARTFGIEVHPFIVRRAEDLAGAFLGMMKNRDQGVLVMSSTFMVVHRKAIVDLAAAHRIAAVYELQGFMEQGGLMSYGVSNPEMERRAATYLDKILRGAKPADLPVEQPTKFELVINLKTAKALGLTIPPSLLLKADQVIE
jgi:putative ABC transport system substrate-binding protein